MKKFDLQRVVLFWVSLLLLSSCIGEEPKISFGNAVGVVSIENKTFKKVLDVGNNVSFYSIMLVNKNPGACFYIYYEFDKDSPENSDENVAANGYYTTTHMQLSEELERIGMLYSITDTSNVLTNEVAVITPILNEYFAYINGVGFIFSVLDISSEQEMDWNLSCDFENMVKEEDGKRYYDVFLRSTVHQSSTNPTTRVNVINPFNMKDFLESIAQEEKNLGNEKFTLRFNYASEIKDDKITWKQQESPLELPVAYILPNE